MAASDEESATRSLRHSNILSHASCAGDCEPLNKSNYADTEVAAAFAQHERFEASQSPLLTRVARSFFELHRLRQLEASAVVDLRTYRAILEHFGARR